MTTPTHFTFSSDRGAALASFPLISDGRGWCNVIPVVEDEVPDMKVNYFGLRLNKGVVVASFVTAPPRRGVAQPSSLGLLHSRSRLGADRIALLLAGANFVVRQDHNTRGLLLDVPVAAPAEQVLEVMCNLTESLCDYQFTGRWTIALFVT